MYQNPLLRLRKSWYRAQSSRSLKYNDKYVEKDKDKEKGPFALSIKIPCCASEKIDTGPKVVAHSSNSGIRDPYY